VSAQRRSSHLYPSGSVLLHRGENLHLFIARVLSCHAEGTSDLESFLDVFPSLVPFLYLAMLRCTCTPEVGRWLIGAIAGDELGYRAVAAATGLASGETGRSSAVVGLREGVDHVINAWLVKANEDWTRVCGAERYEG